MKTHFIKQFPKATVALAEIIPNQLDELLKDSSQFPELEGMHTIKQQEFLATRALIKLTCANMKIPFHGIHKDEFGKPYLTNSEHHISISHSHPMVCCIIHKENACGIDIEYPREQLRKIKSKYLNESELDYCKDDLDNLCQFWSAKESLYKIYGRKKVHFAKALFVSVQDKSCIRGQIKIENYNKVHLLQVEKHNNYYIVYNY